MKLDIWPVALLSDNYAWVLQSPPSSRVVVVDPGDAAPVSRALADRQLELAAILLTHHHGDHTGGVPALISSAEIPVYAPAADGISSANCNLEANDCIHLEFLDLELTMLSVPGHTRGHGAYVGPGFVLSGDTLFAGGCGRVFEGTMEQMFASLESLAALPPETLVYCAHEYTAANLRFASAIEPESEALVKRRHKVAELRRTGRPSIPSTIAEELATNPFLRCREESVVDSARENSGQDVAPGAETFAVIRRWKDGF